MEDHFKKRWKIAFWIRLQTNLKACTYVFFTYFLKLFLKLNTKSKVRIICNERIKMVLLSHWKTALAPCHTFHHKWQETSTIEYIVMQPLFYNEKAIKIAFSKTARNGSALERRTHRRTLVARHSGFGRCVAFALHARVVHLGPHGVHVGQRHFVRRDDGFEDAGVHFARYVAEAKVILGPDFGEPGAQARDEDVLQVHQWDVERGLVELGGDVDAHDVARARQVIGICTLCVNVLGRVPGIASVPLFI